MTDSQSHYDTLGVSEDASQDEIKDAFFDLVREHPPEQDPDAYQRLREAYDVLSDPVSRREYDTMAQRGHEIESLQDEAEALLNQDPPATKTAIKKLKRATVLGPDISLLRNMLGNAYLMDGQPEEALEQFEEALELNPDNEAHHLNCGYALRELERFKEAEEAFSEVWEDDKGDYASARGLATVLSAQERFDEAHEVLDQAIWADDKIDFEDFFCFFDKLQFYAFQQEIEALEEELNTVIDLPETHEDKRFASWMLAQVADDLREFGQYSLCHRFTNAAHELDDGSLELDEVVEQDLHFRRLTEQIEDINESEKIPPLITQASALLYDYYMGHMSEEDFVDNMEYIEERIDENLNVESENRKFKESCKNIKKSKKDIYNINADFFDLIIEAGEAQFKGFECPYCDQNNAVPKRDVRSGAQFSCMDCGNTFEVSGDEAKRSSGGCFVATAVYGDYDHPDVRQLRRFRDETLRRTVWGRTFIAWYYQYGPGLAERLEGHRSLRRGVRWVLSQFVERGLR